MIAPIKSDEARSRIAAVLEAIVSWDGWEQHVQPIASKDWMASREPFRGFFDTYEGVEGEDWLGVMEWAVIEEMRFLGSDLTADRRCIESILSRMKTHPDVILSDN